MSREEGFIPMLVWLLSPNGGPDVKICHPSAVV